MEPSATEPQQPQQHHDASVVEIESRHRKELKALEGERRAAVKKLKATLGKKAKDAIATEVCVHGTVVLAGCACVVCDMYYAVAVIVQK